jgi:hypothetical protein
VVRPSSGDRRIDHGLQGKGEKREREREWEREKEGDTPRGRDERGERR